MNHLALIEKTTSLIAAGDIVGAEGALAELAGRLKQPLQLWVLWPK